MFLSALECLGGPEVATPKQIIEIMQVKGLTNDQVKSHLQKYRLHKRAVLAASTANPPVEMSLQNPKFEEVYFPELWMSINPHSDSRPGQLPIK
ncbi:myb-like transcription factor family protein [Quillaja saponaria]|uniref:Myb-like transcription factor family protein n=1 Tax=Quillaja saponaria TaxID=32244 RepID=A0AAD7Q3Q9_QUISA|nr:myb-like transcription factor family protein [Quillaja saponaria]